MEILIWIIIGIVYAIANQGNRTGRMSVSRNSNGYGRYGVYGMQDDFSLEFDPLEEIRESYNERLKIYYNHNEPKTYLINARCEARLVKENEGEVWFYVKERTNGKSPGKYFEVKGNSIHASTMWAIIDMEFSSITNYYDIKALYTKLNHSVISTGGLQYFNEPIMCKLPKGEVNKSAQNEYCRMEVQDSAEGEKIIICSEIWSAKKYNKPRKFAISANKLVLYGILSEFAKNGNKMLNYIDLLYQYTNRKDCSVKELNTDVVSIQHTGSAKKILKEMEQEEMNQKKKAADKQAEKDNEDIIELEKPEITKYNERNLDL